MTRAAGKHAVFFGGASYSPVCLACLGGAPRKRITPLGGGISPHFREKTMPELVRLTSAPDANSE